MIYLRALLNAPLWLVSKVIDLFMAGVALLYYYLFLNPVFYLAWKMQLRIIQREMNALYDLEIQAGKTKEEAGRKRVEYGLAHARTFRTYKQEKIKQRHEKIKRIQEASSAFNR